MIKTNVLHMVEYYLILKYKEFLTYATTWLNNMHKIKIELPSQTQTNKLQSAERFKFKLDLSWS